MSGLTETAHAKLNLALHVRGRRPDGYHDIETLFAFCEDGDALAAEPADALSIEVGGPFAGELAGAGDNLAMRAAEALRDAAGVTAGAALRLGKHLPVAAGVGGGSADAAAALRLLSRLWGLNPHLAENIALSLGADVPACLLSRSCRGEGAGDRIEPVDLGLAGTAVLLVNPRVPLATAAVFERWDGVDRGSLSGWREGRNDLEGPAISIVPQIREILDWLRSQPGAEFVRMSGSGATGFALFGSEAARDEAEAAAPEQWWRLATTLR